MKLSKKPTDMIICKASNNGDYFISDFVLVNLKQAREFKERILPILESNSLKGSYSEVGVVNFEFFSSFDENINIINEFIKIDLEWAYISITDKEYELLQKECAILDDCDSIIKTEGSTVEISTTGFSFKSFGKYCGTELFASIPLNI